MACRVALRALAIALVVSSACAQEEEGDWVSAHPLSRREKIEFLQSALAQNHDRSSPDVDLHKFSALSGGEKLLHDATELARTIKLVARRLQVQRRFAATQRVAAPAVPSADTNRTNGTSGTEPKPLQLLEVSSSAKASSTAGAGFNNEATKCIMCLYIMEMTERDVGFPQRDFYSDAYPSYASHVQNGNPGPASYFRNFGGAVSQPPGSYNPIPGPGYSFLEVAEGASNARFRATRAAAGAAAQASAGAQTGARSKTKFVAGMMAAMGLSVCRNGKMICRPRLKQPGRRQLERRMMMQAIQSEYMEMDGMMTKSFIDTCGDMPKSFVWSCTKIRSESMWIAEQYLHDYDDDEICSDLKLCRDDQLNVPAAPYSLAIP